MTRVLAVASEIFPLLKTGGLADVVGALPAALKGLGVEMRALVPGYPAVMAALEKRQVVHSESGLFGGPATVVAGTARGLDIFALDAPHLFERTGNPYLGPNGLDWPDNWRRFAALSRVAAEFGRGAVAAFVPSVIHAHDWQAGLAAAYLRFSPEPRARTLLTIHNLAFQGNFAGAIFPELGLPPAAFGIDGVEYYNGVSYLKAGIQYSEGITTVSPTYAEEITTTAGGMGFDGLLRARHDALSGIVNGIDTEIWNPEADPALAAGYGPGRLAQRAANKREIEKRFGLETGDGILFTVISRLTWQKGIDLLGACVDSMVGLGARLAILGSGEPALEGLLQAAAFRHRGRIGVVTGYDENLAHLLQGGADAILVPSRFEPCGLTQFYGLRYGCVPVVARVGGLADTIIDANDAAIGAAAATGLQFFPVETSPLARAIGRAVALFQDQKTWRTIQKSGMRADVSWAKSAARYAALYKSLAAARR